MSLPLISGRELRSEWVKHEKYSDFFIFKFCMELSHQWRALVHNARGRSPRFQFIILYTLCRVTFIVDISAIGYRIPGLHTINAGLIVYRISCKKTNMFKKNINDSFLGKNYLKNRGTVKPCHRKNRSRVYYFFPVRDV